jgi:hypothetical protein
MSELKGNSRFTSTQCTFTATSTINQSQLTIYRW